MKRFPAALIFTALLARAEAGGPGDAAPNAFATGRDPQHAAIAVTSATFGRSATR